MGSYVIVLISFRSDLINNSVVIPLMLDQGVNAYGFNINNE